MPTGGDTTAPPPPAVPFGPGLTASLAGSTMTAFKREFTSVSHTVGPWPLTALRLAAASSPRGPNAPCGWDTLSEG
jgi:hypothetical protein